jgi:hypothetical protein
MTTSAPPGVTIRGSSSESGNAATRMPSNAAR